MVTSPGVLEAIGLAIKVHYGQVDKGGVPYITHLIRVMNQMDSDTERMVAILHDALEDSPLTLEDLERSEYPAEVIEAIDCLTRSKDDTYREYIEKLKLNLLARKVKIADLRDNTDASRSKNLRSGDLLKRYQDALEILMSD